MHMYCTKENFLPHYFCDSIHAVPIFGQLPLLLAMKRALLVLWWWWWWLLLDSTTVDSFSESNLVGIWKLVSNDLPRCEPTIVQRALGQRPVPNQQRSEVLLKLNPDGTFRQCNEGYVEGAWMAGKWIFVAHHERLCLALNRQYYGPAFDIAMDGRLEMEKNGQIIIRGSVYKGRFKLPMSDPNFFRDGLEDSKVVMGAFWMVQRVATSTASQVASMDGVILGDDGVFQ